MKIFSTILALIALVFCKSIYAESENMSAFHMYMNQLAVERDAGRITSSERAKLLHQRAREIDDNQDQYFEEYWKYFEFIAYKRDNGMSEQEANYLIKQKSNEIQMKRDQASALDREARPSSPVRKKTDSYCLNDCLKARYSYDYCESRCSY